VLLRISHTQELRTALNSLTYDSLTRDYLKSDPSDLMKKHGKSFYFASLIFSKSDLLKIARLYKLCRFIDDCADELPESESSLAISSIFYDLDHPESSTPFNLLLNEVEQWGVKRVHLKELLVGAQFDVSGGVIQSEKDLFLYCYRVAGVVGLLMCPLIGVTSERAYPHAIDLGIGMQLTNICRDISEDSQMGRCYLPGGKGLGQSELKILIRQTLDKADQYYNSAYDGLSYIPIRARLVIFLSGELYRHIGLKIRRNNYEVFGVRTYLNLGEKFIVALKSLFKLGKSFFWNPKNHKTKLHSMIEFQVGDYR